jgi:hypothetical protein
MLGFLARLKKKYPEIVEEYSKSAVVQDDVKIKEEKRS